MTTSISGSREELVPELKSLGGHRGTHSLTEVHAGVLRDSRSMKSYLDSLGVPGHHC